MDASSPDVTSPLHYQLYGNGKIGGDTSSKGSQNQLLERQVFSISFLIIVCHLELVAFAKFLGLFCGLRFLFLENLLELFVNYCSLRPELDLQFDLVIN